MTEIGCAGGVALGEVVALEHLGDGGLAGQARGARRPDGAEPLGVAVHLEAVRAGGSAPAWAW